MKMIMPSHAKNVKRYGENLPLFARYQVEAYLAGMFNPTVQLPSGGYIVIDATEALVAVDVNSGRATKEGSIEQTALKTNLEAAAEVARQLRLRDLAGLIVIDFIDMDERKNNASVEKMMKDKLKTDRARIQIGRISGFGLMEMSRQRLRPGMIEATTQPCSVCHGTGLIRSDDNLALSILRTIEEEGTRRRSREVLIKAPVGIANFLMNQKREHIAHIEVRYGLSVRIEGDPHLISPDFSMEKFKTATRVVQQTSHVVSVDTSLMDQIDQADAAEAEAAEAAERAEEAQQGQETQPSQTSSPEQEHVEGEDKPKRKRRRRRRSRGGRSTSDETQTDENQTAEGEDSSVATDSSEEVKPAEDVVAAEADATTEEAPKPKPRSRSRSRKPKAEAVAVDAPASDATVADTTVADATLADSSAPEEVNEAAKVEDTPVADETAVTEVKPKPKRKRAPRKPKVAPEAKAEETTAEAPADSAEPVAVAEASADPVVKAAPKPRAPRKPRTTSKTATPKTTASKTKAAEKEVAVAPEPAPEVVPEPPKAVEPEPKPAAAPVVEPVAAPAQAAEPTPVEPPAPEVKVEAVAETPKPRRKGWWSLGR